MPGFGTPYVYVGYGVSGEVVLIVADRSVDDMTEPQASACRAVLESDGWIERMSLALASKLSLWRKGD